MNVRGRTGTPGVALFLLLVVLRPWLEQTMWLHMVVQIPLLVVAGALLASHPLDTPSHLSASLRSYDVAGAPGLLVASSAIAVWMIPRALDAAVESWMVDAGKFALLIMAGLLGATSWRRAGTVLRLFVLGNAVWMTATVGVFLLDAPIRVCVSYAANDQKLTGYGLVLVALFVAVTALVRSSTDTSARAPARAGASPHAS